MAIFPPSSGRRFLSLDTGAEILASGQQLPRTEPQKSTQHRLVGRKTSLCCCWYA